ncbi:MAG: hypothetical protein QOF77_680 [Solirubrobacteraceae bacterium]|nr:hypothetical protein [Solirubrobacteraceae bacterium]
MVYRATQLALDRTVALKLIAPGLAVDPAFRRRFQDEARLLARIDHPHVVAVHEAGEAEGRLFVSMRWVEGPNLAELLEETAGLSIARALSIVGQVASALEATHARGLVHRDVKPANILIEPREGIEHAYLSDFGIGRRIEDPDDSGAAGAWVGTLDYAAPEQLRSAPLSARVDIYSLGCVLFELLTGRVPYPGQTAIAVGAAPGNDRPPSARELRPELPQELDEVIARAMATDPAERHASAGAFARAAVRARPPPPRSAIETAAPRPPPGASEPPAPSPVPPRARRIALAAALATGAVGGTALILSGGSPAPGACAPDGTRVHGSERFYCDFPQPGDGRTGGSPVVRSSGARVGYLHQGRNWVECQRPGRAVQAGGRSSTTWALTQSDHGSYQHGWGWVNAVYAGGAGARRGPFAAVPNCANKYDATYGQPPGGRSDAAS